VDQRSPAAYVAEFFGTFALVFFITSAVVLWTTPAGAGSEFVIVGLVHFFVLFLLVMTIGSISGCHLNPAITVALASLRKIRTNDAVIYILLQLSGAVAGALMTKYVLNDRVVDPSGPIAQSPEVGTPSLNDTLLQSTFAGAIVEGLGAFFLVWAVIAVAVNPRAAKDWAGIVIGGALGLVVLVAGPLTGASVNPARFFGPALVSGHWDDAWLYIIAPLIGGAIAAQLYWRLFVEPGAATPETGPKGLRQDVNPPR
jgi:MIP family channel proteins